VDVPPLPHSCDARLVGVFRLESLDRKVVPNRTSHGVCVCVCGGGGVSEGVLAGVNEGTGGRVNGCAMRGDTADGLWVRAHVRVPIQISQIS
jgi:hypothetical protein